MWERSGKGLCLVLVFLLVSSVVSFSDDVQPSEMTTEEIVLKLVRLQEERETALDERESLLQQRESEYRDWNDSLIEREQSLNQIEETVSELEIYSVSLERELARRTLERNLILIAGAIGWVLFLISWIL